MNKMQTHEMISALADGQLQGEAFAGALQQVASDPAALEAWHDYHLIGDVLRSGELAAGIVPAAFMAKLSQRIAQESLLTIDSIATPAQLERATGTFDSKTASANDASFRWKLVAGFASLAAVAAISWNAVGGLGGPGAGPAQAQMAGAPAAPSTGGAILANTGSGVMIRDPQLDEMMAAHRQLGDASALQMPAGFLRAATFEGPSR